MAAYAALVSVMHILQDIRNHHRPPISIVDQQFESITENLSFLQQFLEDYSNIDNADADADALESRIAGAAYAAEDVIESHIVDRVQAAYSKGIPYGQNNITSLDFFRDLQKVIQDLDSVKRDVEAHTRENTKGIEDDDQQHNPMQGTSSSLGQKNTTVVGFDDVLIQAIDKLTEEQSSPQVFSIVGMGGIGKTTLARIIYEHPRIVRHFDILAWATISQENNPKGILLGILGCLKHIAGSQESLSRMSEHELGVKLHKSLWTRRYLIVMDDIWSIDTWDKVSVYFPDNGNRSRILLTTRLSNLASELSSSFGHTLEMAFLDEDKSWELFRKSSFGEKSFPSELEDTGKRIAKICKGLPLSIVVIGGLLSKSKQTLKYWQDVARNLTSVVNLDDNERCLRILRLSYNQLPVHLKPCFLYMGVYSEDSEINVSHLMDLWVTEGFLKPVSGKSLEVVAREYFNELTDRNLVLVSKRGKSGEIKCCRTHDLLMDLSVREARNHDFLFIPEKIIGSNNPQVKNNQRRIIVNEGIGYEVYDTLPSAASVVRSLTHRSPNTKLPSPSTFRLLRVLNGTNNRSFTSVFFLRNCGLVNCRYLDHLCEQALLLSFQSSVSHLWNLQKLIVNAWGLSITTSVIWNMPQLRHVEFYHDLILLDPPIRHRLDDERDNFGVLGNLHTLLGIRNFKFSEEAVKRIPNVKKLKISYKEGIKDWSSCCLENLVLLRELESLTFRVDFQKEPSPPRDMLDLALPHSLKKLTLWGTKLQWEDMAEKIGSLPNLLVLELKADSFVGSEWETVEDQFCSLKYLKISECCDLIYWRTESNHFPCLERLFLIGLDKLDEIPWDIGEIPTMKSIELQHCSDSTVTSADEIVKEQIENFGSTECLQVKVVVKKKNPTLESLVSPNIKIEIRI